MHKLLHLANTESQVYAVNNKEGRNVGWLVGWLNLRQDLIMQTMLASNHRNPPASGSVVKCTILKAKQLDAHFVFSRNGANTALSVSSRKEITKERQA